MAATLRYKKFNSKAAGFLKYLADEYPADSKIKDMKIKFAQATQANEGVMFNFFHTKINPDVKQKVIEMDDTFISDLATSQADVFNIANLWDRPGASTKDLDRHRYNIYVKLQDLLRA